MHWNACRYLGTIVPMRIIKESRVKEFMTEHAKARRMLERWVRLTRRALWRKFADVRATFPDADEVFVSSGRKAIVFDINGNDFRLITAVHYMRRRTRNKANEPSKAQQWEGGRVFVFYFLTHAEYDSDAWKETL
jgi:mRNA interferase HigB